jgi:hypothetical protein
MEKNHQDKQVIHYNQPLPIYPKTLTKFDGLAYVATLTLYPKPKSNFNHSVGSLFQPIIPQKK